MRRPLLAALALSTIVGLTSPARSARADGGARLRARDLAEQGDAQFYAGRCDRAVTLWRQAFAVYRAPTIMVRVARCEELVGHVVAAARTLEAIAGEALAADAPPAFVSARAEATRELPLLRARIATLRIAVRRRGGAWLVPVSIAIDGAPAPGGAIPIDPGPHRVRVQADGAEWERAVYLQDGEARTLDVALWTEPLPAVPWAPLGVAAFGAGAVAMATGVGLSVSALSTVRGLDGAPGADSRARSYSFAAEGTLIGGAALVLTGAVLVTANVRVGHESRIRFAAAPRGVILTGEL